MPLLDKGDGQYTGEQRQREQDEEAFDVQWGLHALNFVKAMHIPFPRQYHLAGITTGHWSFLYSNNRRGTLWRFC
jgi:hypothetical protein